ncbi:MAG: nitroreductase family protein [Bacteroidales bacterium]|nr:nitroreductase family protein [Bacteroidales bacterium]MBN2698837.1 nitroreductase family protein [Bacteroidales bacterium]
MNTLKELILRNRSYRRFDESHAVSRDDLLEMIDAARCSASARNAQPLKYILSNDRALNAKIFSCLTWAGYLEDWPGPAKGERPAAYIVQMHDTTLATDYYCDDGIAAQSILLTAAEKGLGGCIIASVQRETLTEILNIPPHLRIIQVIAIGKPAEQVVLEPVKAGDIKYWRDKHGVHHVPKRPLEELVINIE